ncbi:hypothetical protein INR49_001035 [Caranx melampygus]|nr:hypothetical protein INR49_001035 [Caranx melampygus]
MDRQDTAVPAKKTHRKRLQRRRKVFSKLNFHVPEETVKKIALSTAGVIEPVLSVLREKIDKKLEHVPDNTQDPEYFDTRTHRKPHADIQQTEAKLLAQLAEEDMRKHENSRPRNGL